MSLLAVASGKICHACDQSLPRASFSGSMWRRTAQRRCMSCVDANRLVPSATSPSGSAGDAAAAEDLLVAVTETEIHVAKLSALAALSPEDLKRALEHSARSQLRNIAIAAGVSWGGKGAEEMPARMQEMQCRHDTVLALSDQGELTLQKIKEYHDWIARLTTDIANEGEAMTRGYRLAMAKYNRCHDPKRAKAYLSQAEVIRAKEKRYNNEVTMAKHEMAWLLESPAWKKAMEFLRENWVQTAKGDWVSKKDLEDDMSLSFESLLASMKAEEGAL